MTGISISRCGLPGCWDRAISRPTLICLWLMCTPAKRVASTGDMLRKIDERLSREGLTFGIHNHYFKQKFAYESPDDVLKALAGRSKTMGATLRL